jgi:ribose transport system permease protein
MSDSMTTSPDRSDTQEVPEETPVPPAPPRFANLAQGLTRWSVLIGYVIMVAIFAVLRPDTFLTTSTATNLLDQATIPAVLVCGLTFILASGEFDLSFTAVLGLCAGVVIVLMSQNAWPVALACLAALAVAVGLGLVVGLLVTVGRASSFIVTLAVSSVVAGLELALTDNKTIYENVPVSFTNLSQREILGLHQSVWIMLVFIVISGISLHATRFGRHVSAIGGNPTAAFLAGIRVRRVRVACFVVVAVLAGVAAILRTATAGSYFPNSSAGFLLNSYAAVFLGAAAARSGRFTIVGSVFGVIWLLTLQTGLTQLNQPAWASTLFQGLILSIAVLLAARGRREGDT